MNLEKLRDALEPASEAVVRNVYDIVKEHVKSEADRQKIIESKASMMLSAIGLSMTLCLAFGWQILTSPLITKFAHQVLTVAFVVAVLSGVGAGLCALMGLLVATYRGLNEANVFNAELLKQSSDGKTYLQFLALHLWHNAQRDVTLHEEKAAWTERSQKCFLAFILSVSLISLLVYVFL